MAKHLNQVTTKPKTQHRDGGLNTLRHSHAVQYPVTGAIAIGLILGIGLPATAAPMSADAPVVNENTDVTKPANQTLKVSNAVVDVEVSRDGYTATDPAIIAAMREAEAIEEARVAAEAKAAEDARLAEEARVQAAAQAKVTPGAINGNFTVNPPATAFSGDAVVAYAEQFVGVVPYGHGNSPSDSFSCDGLVQYVFGQFGISLPRGVTSQAALGTPISASDARAGDVVVWPGQHIGIYDGHGGIIHSPNFGRKVTHANFLWGSYQFYRFA